MIRSNSHLDETVTAFFATAAPLSDLLDSLHMEGIDEPDVQIYVGHEDVDWLGVRRQHHGVIIRSLSDFIALLWNEAPIQSRLERALHEGGHFVMIDTEGDELRRAVAMEVLETNGGEDVHYWGSSMMKRMRTSATG